MKKIFLLFLFGCYLAAKAQICDTVVVEDISKLEKWASKHEAKVKADKELNLDALKCFEVAQYRRVKSDSVFINWYVCAARNFKTAYSKEKSSSTKAEFLYKLGLCYFFVSDFRMAEAFFAKALKAKYTSPCAHYYLSLSKTKSGKPEEADIEMKIFEKEIGK